MHGDQGFHWGFGLGHWSIGLLIWISIIVLIVLLLKMLFDKKE